MGLLFLTFSLGLCLSPRSDSGMARPVLGYSEWRAQAAHGEWTAYFGLQKWEAEAGDIWRMDECHVLSYNISATGKLYRHAVRMDSRKSDYTGGSLGARSKLLRAWGTNTSTMAAATMNANVDR